MCTYCQVPREMQTEPQARPVYPYEQWTVNVLEPTSEELRFRDEFERAVAQHSFRTALARDLEFAEAYMPGYGAQVYPYLRLIAQGLAPSKLPRFQAREGPRRGGGVQTPTPGAQTPPQAPESGKEQYSWPPAAAALAYGTATLRKMALEHYGLS